jgi:hypothetical protein
MKEEKLAQGRVKKGDRDELLRLMGNTVNDLLLLVNDYLAKSSRARFLPRLAINVLDTAVGELYAPEVLEDLT